LLRSFAPGDISVAGPLARSAADLALAFDVVRGPDPADGRVEIVLPAPRTKRLRGMRVAVWPSDDATTTDPEIVEKLEALARRLEREGAKVDRRARPAFDAKPAFDVYLQLLGAAIGSRLGPEQLEAARARDALRARDDDGTDAIFERSFEISHRAWLALNERRHVLRRTWQAFFEQWDVLVCPAFGTPALPHDPATPTEERRIILDGRDIAYNDLLFWPGIIGAYHLPATVAPLGFTRAGLPVGVQIVGPPFGDRTTLEFARLLERAWLGFTPPPSC
jgi:amidase